MSLPLAVLGAADLEAEFLPRWCPGCGNYAILAQLKVALARAGAAPGGLRVVTGVGCHGRTAHYLAAPAFQTLPGQAFAVATGLLLARPTDSVWVVTGDGDCLRGPGFLQLVRRNLPVRVLILNNEIGGLSRGTATPSSRAGTHTRTSPGGSSLRPLAPLALAVGAGATFAARTLDVDARHLADTLSQATNHPGTAVVEILQNCVTYNDEVWAPASDRALRPESVVELAPGQPLVFGRDREWGLELDGGAWAVRPSGPNTLRHAPDGAPGYATLLAQLAGPVLPLPLGVLRAVKEPTWLDALEAQRATAGNGDAPGGRV